MRKTATPAKAIDCDAIHGPRRKKQTGRFEVWRRTKDDSHLHFKWVGKWMLLRKYNEQHHAVAYVEKLGRQSNADRWLVKIVDAETGEVVWESDK